MRSMATLSCSHLQEPEQAGMPAGHMLQARAGRGLGRRLCLPCPTVRREYAGMQAGIHAVQAFLTGGERQMHMQDLNLAMPPFRDSQARSHARLHACRSFLSGMMEPESRL